MGLLIGDVSYTDADASPLCPVIATSGTDRSSLQSAVRKSTEQGTVSRWYYGARAMLVSGGPERDLCFCRDRVQG